MTTTTTTAPAVSAIRIMSAHEAHTVDTGLLACRRAIDTGATYAEMVTEAKRVGMRGASRKPGAWILLADIESLPWAPGTRPVYTWEVLVGAASAVYNAAESRAEWDEALEDAEDRADAIETLLTVAASAREADRTRKGSGSGTGKKAPKTPAAPVVKARGNGALIADALAALKRVEVETLTEAEAMALAALVAEAQRMGRAFVAARPAA